MITLLSRFFIPDRENKKDPKVRKAYGVLCSALGIALNLLLFAAKALTGLVSGSIAILADAFNNLSDAGSSIITLIGFCFGALAPDRGHPFGHGRAEYLSGLAVAGIILLMGAELIRTSLSRILHPAALACHPATIALLAVSILVKLYMYFYNRKTADQIQSAAMRAAATDSLGDVLATGAVLAATLAEYFAHIHADGWCGLLVGAFIFYAGLRAARDTINPLLGQAPDPDFVKKVEQIVRSEPLILDLHDLIVHNYGPGRTMISLHAEVSADGDLLQLHDAIDAVERRLQQELSCSAVIHMDPLATHDEETLRLKQRMTDAVHEIDPALKLHDFRIVKGRTHTRIIFDVLVPYQFPFTDSQIISILDAKAKQMDPSYETAIDVDKA